MMRYNKWEPWLLLAFIILELCSFRIIPLWLGDYYLIYPLEAVGQCTWHHTLRLKWRIWVSVWLLFSCRQWSLDCFEEIGFANPHAIASGWCAGPVWLLGFVLFHSSATFVMQTWFLALAFGFLLLSATSFCCVVAMLGF